MRIGLIIYGSLNTLSGGYWYDRKLVEYLSSQGDAVEVISLPWRTYAAHLTDNLHFKLPGDLDILIQDELNHPSLIGANHKNHPYPILSLVHHLRCLEQRPAWQNWVFRFVEKIYLAGVDGHIFNSKTTQAAVQDLIGNAKPCLIANPPTDRFGEALAEEEIGARAQMDPFRILFLGNIIERKGLHTLLEALRQVQSVFHLDVVGSNKFDPEYANRIQAYCAGNHLAAAVTFHGSLESQSLEQRLRQSHVMILPSTYEGFGIAYLEGMGFGLPAIGTTQGAAREIITHDQNGYLIEPGDHSALAALISSMAENRQRLIRLSLAARRRYLQQPSWEQTAASMRGFLADMVR
jgi:glycosyltransferase involved in cell wall biosynthesis